MAFFDVALFLLSNPVCGPNFTVIQLPIPDLWEVKYWTRILEIEKHANKHAVSSLRNILALGEINNSKFDMYMSNECIVKM